MNEWTIFYWGWWIAWAPFVGMFIAKISRGRTVRNIINGAMTGPVLYGCDSHQLQARLARSNAPCACALMRLWVSDKRVCVSFSFVRCDSTECDSRCSLTCSFFWFATFGGIGIRIERQAANLGITCEFDDEGTLINQPMLEIDGLQYWRLSCRKSEDQWFDMVTNFPMERCALERSRCAVAPRTVTLCCSSCTHL